MRSDAAPERFQLADGTPACARPICPDDGVYLQRGLARLSPQSNVHRFLHRRLPFSEADLRYLTHCDFNDHIAVILAITDSEGNQLDEVGVARSIRTKEDPQLAEVAIVLIDEWQGLGGGRALLRYLARLAWQSGIRRWQAFYLADNIASPLVLATAGEEISCRSTGYGTMEAIYEIESPQRS